MSEYINHSETKNNDINKIKSTRMINNNNHAPDSSDSDLTSTNSNVRIDIKSNCVNNFMSSDLSLASDIVIEATPFDNFVLPSCMPNGTNHSMTDQKTGNNIDHLMNGQQNHNENKSNNPKEFGKFRILKEYTSNNDHDLKNTNDNSSYLKLNGSTQLNGSYDGISNGVSNEVDILATDNDTIVATDNIVENGKEPAKRRGKPKKQTAKKKINNNNNQNNNSKDDPGGVENFDASNENEFQTRRRSKRLRNLEKNNPTENDSSQSSSQTSKNSTAEKSVVVNGDNHTDANENPSHPKSKSNKKNKSKHKSKTKDNKNSKKHEAKSKAKHKSQKSEHKKHNNNNNNKSHSSKENNFTLPQEPSTLSKDSTTINDIDNDNEDDSTSKPEKVKSRWRRNSELENTTVSSSSVSSPKNENDSSSKNHHQVLQDCTNEKSNTNEKLPNYVEIEDNQFLFEKKKCKSKKETKKMVCDCILTKEERNKGLMGCGEDCLNRMLMIECGSRCTLEEHCSNKRFQKKQNCKVKPFKTEKKGWGLMASEAIPPDTFIMEYVGEVIDPFMFHKRVEKYSKAKIEHYYFMALKSDEIIDATTKGNITRFINHSCEPNAMTQKWTVNGELRIGFFSIKPINPGEEITFDYQFQRYGKKAQRCYCETKSCRGYIGTSENANILTDGSKIPKKVPKTDAEEEEDEIMEEEDFLEDLALEEEIDMLAENGGLRNRQQILVVSRLMLRAERCELRIQLIDIIMGTVELAYLRLFLDYHGLQIIWGWMIEADDVDLKARLLELLEILPIPNKTMLVSSKVWQVVERWAAVDSLESQQYLHLNDDAMSKDSKDEKDKNIKNEKESETDKDKPSPEAIKTEPIEENETIEVDKSDGKKLTKSEPPTLEKDSSNQKTETVNGGEKKTTEQLAAKLSGKIVIKTKSKTNINENGSQTNANAKNKNNVTIGFLAQKLLTHWKDLKEVFTIPRLERQKRRDDEAEADRRAKEEEERRAQGLPINYDEKRSISHKNYAIAGILGKNRETYRSFSSRIAFRRNNHNNNSSSSLNSNNNFMLNNNNSNLSSTSPAKISKEDFRKRFEMNLQYSEMVKQYKEQLSIYQNHMAQQFFNIATMHQNSNNNNNDGNKAAAPVPPTVPFHELYRQYSNELTNDNGGGGVGGNVKMPVQQYVAPLATINQFTDQQLVQTSYTEQFNSTNLTSIGEQHSDMVTVSNNFNELDYMDVDFKDLVPEYQSPLVVLSENDSCFQNDSTLSPYAIDNVDFSQIKFESDNCIESMEKKMFDEMYPPAGIFYVTKKGRTYFVSLPKDDSTQGGIVVKENLTEPLPLSFTQKKPNDRLLSTICDWKCSQVDGHHYYYNKRKQIKQWHPPQDNQIDNYINDDDQPMDTLCDFSHASTCSSPLSISHVGSHRKEQSYRKKKRNKEQFRNKISQFVVKCLNPYMKSSCRKAKITNSDDFKNLARKLTHTIVGKEMKQCKHIEDLAYTESVKIKTKEYVKRYMSRFGSIYRKESSREKSISPPL